MGDQFIGKDRVALVLGDNVFYGHGFSEVLERAAERTSGATIFGYWVKNPTAYGVVDFDEHGKALSIEEKPKEPKSNYAVPGLYFYGPDVVQVATSITPSARGELEITSVNQHYLDEARLTVTVLPRGTAWLDTGSFDSLADAGAYVRVLEERQGTKVACLEEYAWRNGWIDDNQLALLAEPMIKSGYGTYLLGLLTEVRR